MTTETKQPTHYNFSIALSYDQDFIVFLCEDEETAKALKLDEVSTEQRLKEKGKWTEGEGFYFGVLGGCSSFKGVKEQYEYNLDSEVSDYECVSRYLWRALELYFKKDNLRLDDSLKENNVFIDIKIYDGTSKYSEANLKKWIEQTLEPEKLSPLKEFDKEFFELYGFNLGENIRITC